MKYLQPYHGLLLIGGGGHCRAVLDILSMLALNVDGIVDNDTDLHDVLGIPVVGTDNDIPNLRKKYDAALVTIGQIKNPNSRRNIYRLLKNSDYILPTIISPLAHVSHYAIVDSGTVVMHMALINSKACVGKNCIINSRAIIEHDVIVGNHCHISTGTILNGGVHVGDSTFIGSGAIVREGVSIGKECIIGMGTIIKHDVSDGCMIVGYHE